MSRRSRSRRQSGFRFPLLVVVALAVLGAGAWWWSQRDTTPDATPPASAPATGDPQRLNEVLPLPPVEDTRPTGPVPPAAGASSTDSLPGFLPAEARHTLQLIRQGGPFPHRQDGGVFGNREGRLPRQPNGYYREYTVDTPGLDHRGARRIVTGGQPPREFYYTEDHYESFRRFETGPAGANP